MQIKRKFVTKLVSRQQKMGGDNIPLGLDVARAITDVGC